MKNLFARRTVSERIVFSIVFLMFIMVALSYIYIFGWGFVAGLKTHDEVILNPFGLPETPHFEHYLEVFTRLKVQRYDFFGMLFNSMYFSVLGPLITNMMACMLAYATTKYKFPGSKLYGIIVTFIVILPIYGSGGSAYRLYYKLGLISSYSQIILAFGGMNMTYLYFQAAFSNLSWGYAEAAFIFQDNVAAGNERFRHAVYIGVGGRLEQLRKSAYIPSQTSHSCKRYIFVRTEYDVRSAYGLTVRGVYDNGNSSVDTLFRVQQRVDKQFEYGRIERIIKKAR